MWELKRRKRRNHYYLFTLLFIKSQYTFCFFSFFAHLVLHISLFCTFYSIAHFIRISLFFSIYMLLCCVTFISLFMLLHCPLSGPDLMYILLLIIPCIIYYVTNKETLNLEEPSTFRWQITSISAWEAAGSHYSATQVTSWGHRLVSMLCMKLYLKRSES